MEVGSEMDRAAAAVVVCVVVALSNLVRFKAKQAKPGSSTLDGGCGNVPVGAEYG